MANSLQMMHVLTPAELQRVVVVEDARIALSRIEDLHRMDVAPVGRLAARRTALAAWFARALGHGAAPRPGTPWAQRHPLLAGDPDAIADALARAFGARDLEADVQGVLMTEVDLVTHVDVAAQVPSVLPISAPMAAPTLRMMTLAERSGWASTLLAGHALRLARVAFGAAPTLAVCHVSVRDATEGLLLSTMIDRDALAAADLDQPAWSMLTRIDPWARLGAAALALVLAG